MTLLHRNGALTSRSWFIFSCHKISRYRNQPYNVEIPPESYGLKKKTIWQKNRPAKGAGNRVPLIAERIVSLSHYSHILSVFLHSAREILFPPKTQYILCYVKYYSSIDGRIFLALYPWTFWLLVESLSVCLILRRHGIVQIKLN